MFHEARFELRQQTRDLGLATGLGGERVPLMQGSYFFMASGKQIKPLRLLLRDSLVNECCLLQMFAFELRSVCC